MSEKNFRKISNPKMDISLYLSNLSKEVSNKQTNRLTHIKEIQNYLELVNQHSRNV